MATICTVLGPILVATAVADTIGGIVTLDPPETLLVLLGALLAGLIWNIVTWYAGLPSSSSHALVGGLVGAGLVMAGRPPFAGVAWTGCARWGHPRGAGGIGDLPAARSRRRLDSRAGRLSGGLHRGTRALRRPVLQSEWVASGALAFAHGANDAQKTMGVLTLAPLVGGAIPSFVVPLWVKPPAGRR